MNKLPTSPSDKRVERNKRMINLALYTLLGIAVVCAILLLIFGQQ